MLTLAIEELAGPLSSGNARTRWTHRTSLLLRLTDEQGKEGRGECAPLPGYSRESLNQCRASLQTIELSSTSALQSMLLKTPLPAAAAFGLESALLELMDLATPPAGPALRVATLDPEKPASSLKLKIGPHTSLAGLPTQRPLRFDANQTLALASATAVLAQLKALNAEFVEEPVPFEQLRALNARSPERPPIALDESLQGPSGPERLRQALGEGWAEVVVLKPMALGPSATRVLLCIAQEHSAPVVMSHLLAGPVAFAATCHWALSLDSPLPQGLGRHPGLVSFDGWSTTLGEQGMIAPWTSAHWPVLAPRTKKR